MPTKNPERTVSSYEDVKVSAVLKHGREHFNPSTGGGQEGFRLCIQCDGARGRRLHLRTSACVCEIGYYIEGERSEGRPAWNHGKRVCISSIASSPTHNHTQHPSLLPYDPSHPTIVTNPLHPRTHPSSTSTGSPSSSSMHVSDRAYDERGLSCDPTLDMESESSLRLEMDGERTESGEGEG